MRELRAKDVLPGVGKTNSNTVEVRVKCGASEFEAQKRKTFSQSAADDALNTGLSAYS